MNVRLLNVLSLSLAGALALSACSGETDPPMVDAGPDVDTGVVADTGADTGVDVDTGIDTGVQPMPCPDGEEGCFCDGADRDPMATAFVQGSCDANLLCAPWDTISGREGDVTTPLASCIKPCTANADCTDATRPNRVCSSSFGFTADSGAPSFCVDSVNEVDQFCGGSRLIESKIPDVQVQTGRQMIGCTTGDCTLGAFGDVHPDEGICLEICENDGECNDANRNACNLIFQSQTSTDAVGICSVGPLPGRGDFCGTEDPEKIGLVNRCNENDPNEIVICAATNLYNGIGFCLELCGSAHVCAGLAEPPDSTCEIIDPADTEAGGVCLAECENTPENCDGPGQFGEGRFCFENRVLFNVNGGDLPFVDCMSRRPQNPAFSLSFLNRFGNDIEVLGDNCDDPAISAAFAGCAEPTFCLGVGQDQGVCATGCDLTIGGRGGCEAVDGQVTGTATCTPALNDGAGGIDQENGLCGVIP